MSGGGQSSSRAIRIVKDQLNRGKNPDFDGRDQNASLRQLWESRQIGVPGYRPIRTMTHRGLNIGIVSRISGGTRLGIKTSDRSMILRTLYRISPPGACRQIQGQWGMRRRPTGIPFDKVTGSFRWKLVISSAMAIRALPDRP